MLYFTKYGVKLKRNLMQRMGRMQSQGNCHPYVTLSQFSPYMIVTSIRVEKFMYAVCISNAVVCL
jgi:hypothetical protein